MLKLEIMIIKSIVTFGCLSPYAMGLKIATCFFSVHLTLNPTDTYLSLFIVIFAYCGEYKGEYNGTE